MDVNLSRSYIPIEGLTMATGRLPASFKSIASAKAFVNAKMINKKFLKGFCMQTSRNNCVLRRVSKSYFI